jgi:hypothetical protein
MKGFKRCASGHFFKDNLDHCPYCPAAASSGSSDKDATLGDLPALGDDADLGKTQVLGSPDSSDRTQIFAPSGSNDKKSSVFGGGPSNSSNRDLSRTFIQEGPEEENSENATPSAPRATRKIVGWIISFDLDPMGMDYRIFEGKNTAGRDPKNTITITKDTTISGEHAILLYRSGKYYIEDAMTANGTFLNGEELEPRKAYTFKDGDRLKFGNSEFLFKSAF